MEDKDVYNHAKNIVLTFSPVDSDKPETVVVERGAHYSGETEYYVRVGLVIAAHSGLPFPEATVTALGRPCVHIPLPVPGNGASERNDAARTALANAVAVFLRAAVAKDITTAVVTDEGTRVFTMSAAPASQLESQNEQVGADISAAASETPDMREEF